MSGAEFARHLRPRSQALDLEALFDQIVDEKTWAAVAPETSTSTSITPPTLKAESEDEGATRSLEREGWARLGPVLDREALSITSAAIGQVRALGLPAVFAYLFPEFWRAILNPTLQTQLVPLLGAARQLPRSWITILAPLAKAKGWPAHLDAQQPPTIMSDGLCDRLTLWIALTDATLDNGCMMVVPSSAVGTFPADLFEQKTVASARALQLLQAVRPLPCPAGHALAWRTDVIHFSAALTGQSAEPRVAVALHLLHPEASVSLRERPVRELFGPALNHQERVAFVARQVLAYQAYAEQLPQLRHLVPLAHKLLQGV